MTRFVRHRLVPIAMFVIAPSGRGLAQRAVAVGAPVTLESFDDAQPFVAVPSDGVRLELRTDEGRNKSALRLQFDFQGRAGYAVARRPFTLPALPSHWVITLWVRGETRPNTLELKLVDSTGQNVWWMRRPELSVTPGWTQLRFRASDLSYAWGPLGGGPPRGIAALEIAFTAGQGGRGWLALDELTLVPQAAPVAESARPRLSSSTAQRGRSVSSVVPKDFFLAPRATTMRAGDAGWHSADDGTQSITLDFGGPRPLSALVLDWSSLDWPVDYDIETSDDGRTWTVLRQVRHGGGGRRFIHLPGIEPNALRLTMRRSSAKRGYGLNAVHVLSDSAAGTTSAFLERVGQGSHPGTWPRPLSGQQTYWTVVGLPRDERDALMSEDGSVESKPGSFSIEPFLGVDGQVLTWRDGVTRHSLERNELPIPTVRRIANGLALSVTSFATGATDSSNVYVRYRVVNLTARPRAVQLSVAVRPVQVNPPWQFLGSTGGAAPIRLLRWDGAAMVVNDSESVFPLSKPTTVGVVPFDSGSVIDLVRDGKLPSATSVSDPAALAEGAMQWTLSVSAKDSADVWVALPERTVRMAHLLERTADVARFGEQHLDVARRQWNNEILSAVRISLPGSGASIAQTLRTALGHVLINARGPAIQPGTRSYRRSWIRDGALTSAALLRLGHEADVKRFLDWFLPFVFPNGKVPCCVDHRGADPVTENDADGELLYLAAEYFRFTKDTATIRHHWPTLLRVAAHLDSLRNSRRTSAYRTPDSLFVFGLLPPSISHEGYSAKPAYSYWDDWWGVRGLDDAGLLGRVAGDTGAASRYAAAGREMRREVVASVARSMALHHQPTLPGAAELGDTDPTSSTMALEPAQALDDLPRAAVQATFDSAWATLQRRRLPGSKWDIFVPYEWRDVGAYVRLNEPERAHSYASWLLDTRRPTEWHQWSEGVWREARLPKFIGDMPHGWVASDFMRATMDMIAYERERDSALVVGAAIPFAWATGESGVAVRGLRTWWGPLSLDMRRSGPAIHVRIEGVSPPGGVELRAPFDRRPRSIWVNGARATTIDDGRAVMLHAPATVELRY